MLNTSFRCAMRLSVPLLLGTLAAVSLAQTPATPVAISTPKATPKPPIGKTSADVIKQSIASDWRPLDMPNTLVMELGSQQVVIELAPQFAPQHVANIKTLAQAGYYDGLVVLRVQDNYVAQWADPNDDDDATSKGVDKSKIKPLGKALAKLPAEFSVRFKSLPAKAITPLPDRDEWAPFTGFMNGMPVAANPKADQAWLAHCYGVVGAARGNAPDSSNGTNLYAIIGHAPRNLDLNITTVGRVVKGADALASLPRGPGAMGFYDKPESFVRITRARMLADIPTTERPAIEIMRTDTATWAALLEAARNPGGEWYAHKPGHTNVCNRPVPTRPTAAAS